MAERRVETPLSGGCGDLCLSYSLHEFVTGVPRLPDDRPQYTPSELLSRVVRDNDTSPIRVLENQVTSFPANNRKPGSFKHFDDFFGLNRA